MKICIEVPKYLEMALEYLSPQIRNKVLHEYKHYLESHTIQDDLFDEEMALMDEIGSWPDDI